MQCITGRIAHLFPDVWGLVGLYAWPPNPFAQQSARLKGDITEHLRVHAKTRTVCQEQISRIFGELLGSRLCPLPVRRRHHHELVDVLDIPPALTKLDGEPVQQFRICGPLAHDAKIFRGFHDPSSEKLIPHSVHGYTCGERLLGADSPVGECQSIVWLSSL